MRRNPAGHEHLQWLVNAETINPRMKYHLGAPDYGSRGRRTVQRFDLGRVMRGREALGGDAIETFEFVTKMRFIAKMKFFHHRTVGTTP